MEDDGPARDDRGQLAQELRLSLRLAAAALAEEADEAEAGRTLRCPLGHPLQPLVASNTGWCCSGVRDAGGCAGGLTGFFQTDGLRSYRCHTCDYDLCSRCLRRRWAAVCPEPRRLGVPGPPRGGTWRDRAWARPWWVTWAEGELQRPGVHRAQVVGAGLGIGVGGCPPPLRPRLWAALAAWGADEGGVEAAGGDAGAVARQIELDLERTPDALFVGAGASGLGLAQKRAAARRLLLEYSRRRPDVGYCQGLNFVAAALLRALPGEGHALLILRGLLGRLPRDLHSADPERLHACRGALQRAVLRTLAAPLAAHLAALDVDANLFLPRWLSCLFASTLPEAALERLWDQLLASRPCDGGPGGAAAVLARLAAALLGRAEAALLRAGDVPEAMAALSAVARAAAAGDVERMLIVEWPEERLRALWPVGLSGRASGSHAAESSRLAAASSSPARGGAGVASPAARGDARRHAAPLDDAEEELRHRRWIDGVL